MEDLLVLELFVAVIAAAIVQALKTAGLPSRWSPLASLVIATTAGILWAVAIGAVSLLYGAAGGLFAGAMASGAYSGTKALMDRE